MKTVVFVVGMHRSGTSALARVLALCGAALPRDIMRANYGNPHGYWEPRRAVSLNDDLLASVGSRWDEQRTVQLERLSEDEGGAFMERAVTLLLNGFTSGDVLVLKDPRVTLLLPFWLAAAQHCGMRSVAVVAYRPASEVADSLARRDGTAAEHAHRVWLNYCLAGERDTADIPRTFVEYRDLLTNWELVVRRIAQDLELPLTVTPAVREAVAAYLTPPDEHAFDAELARDRYDAVAARMFVELIGAERRGADRAAFAALASRIADLDSVEA